MTMASRRGRKSSGKHLLEHLAHAARGGGTLELRVGAAQLFLREDTRILDLGLPDPYDDAIAALHDVLGESDEEIGTLYGFDVEVVRDVDEERFLVRAQRAGEPFVDLTKLVREAVHANAPRKAGDLLWHRAAFAKARELRDPARRAIVLGMLLERATRDAPAGSEPDWERHLAFVREAFVAATTTQVDPPDGD